MKFKTHNFIERTLLSALAFFKESIFAQEFALKKGFLQGLDPRIKTLSFLFFLLAILFTKNISVVIVLYLFCLLLAMLSKISLPYFLKRTLVFIPIFSLFISLPAVLRALILGGRGFFNVAIFLARITASVSFVILLSLTTKHTELLRVLRIFKVPQIFIMTLSMCYRYIYLLVEIMEQNFLAVKSRIGGRIHLKKGQHIAAFKIASLWQSSAHLNKDAYDAMLSRGYTGEPVVLDEFHSGKKDWLWLIFVLLIFILTTHYG